MSAEILIVAKSFGTGDLELMKLCFVISIRIFLFQDEVNNTLNWLGKAEERLDNIALLLDGENTPSLVEKAKRQQSDLQADFEKNKIKLDRAVTLGNTILANADTGAVGTLKHWIGALSAGWQEVNAWIDQLGDRIKV